MSSFVLLYCAENQDIAQKFSHDLGTVGANFIHFVPSATKPITDLANHREPIIALISDNFLKKEECLKNAYFIFSDLVRNGQMIIIVTDGKAQLPDGTFITVNTHFERVSNVIRYMNFWQDNYLDARRKHHQHEISDRELGDIRDISNQIGDIIRLLRESNYQNLDNVVDKNYLAFCQISGLPQPSIVSEYKSVSPSIPPIVATVIPSFAIPETKEVEIENKIENEVENEVKTEIVEIQKEVEAIEAAAVEEDVLIEKFEENVTENITENITEQTAEVIDIQEIATPTIDVESETIEENKLSEDDTIEEIIANIPGMNMLQEKGNIVPMTTTNNAIAIDEDDFFEEPKIVKSDSNINEIINEVLEEESNEEGDETTNIIDTTNDNDDNEKPDLSLVYDDEDDDNGDDDDIKLSIDDLIGEKVSNEIEDDDDELDEIISGSAATMVVNNHFSDKFDPEIAAILERQAAEAEAIVPTATEVVLTESVETITDDDTDDEVTEVIKEENNDETTDILAQMKEEETSESSLLDAMKAEITVDPNNSRLRLRYAVALAQLQNNWQEASRQVTAVLENEPHNADAYYLLGEMAEINRDAMMAANYFERVADINPSYPNIFYKLAEVSATLSDVDVKKTKKYYKNAIALDENNADLLYAYASFLDEKADKKEKAIKYYKKALDFDPQHPFANYDIATAYFSLNEPYEAADFYQKAIAINPELKTLENDEAFTIKPILTEERAEEAINIGNNDNDVQQFEALIDNSIVADTPNQPIETPTINQEIAQAVNQVSVMELEKSDEKIAPNPTSKIVMITGATSGIGRATAEILAKDGYNLILTGRRKERLEALAQRFNNDYEGTTITLDFDVQQFEQVQNALQTLDNQWLNIDVLLNNAGLGLGLSPIHEGELAQWETMIDTNIKGLLYMTRLIAPRMVERKSGHIVNLCSTAGKEAYPNGNVYCATKFAVEALTKSMRIDLHKHNIRVSQVSPGAVEETEFSVVRFEGNEARAAKVYEDFQALKASDVAEVIHFIISRPAHVNIQDVLLMGTQQATASMIDRSGR